MNPITASWRRWLEAVLLLTLLGAVWIMLFRDRLPGLVGYLNDDGLYVSYARALLTGQGYVMLSEPGHPPAIRYPILFPALLAAVMAGAGSLTEQITRLQWVPPTFAAAFVGLSYLYLRFRASWPIWTALLGTLILALHPQTYYLGSVLLSDLPFAALLLGAVWVIESGIERPSKRWRWIAAGLLVAGACLTRYAGAALLLATLLLLLKERRFRAFGWFSASFGLLILPWLAFRALMGEHYYLTEYASSLPHDPTALFRTASSLCAHLLSNSLPGMLLPWGFSSRGLGIFVLGTLLSTLVLLGTLAWLRRPHPGETFLPGMLILTTLGLTLVWGVGFPEQDDAFLSRSLLPIAPFLLIACRRGGAELMAWREVGSERLHQGFLLGSLSLAVLTTGWQGLAIRNSQPAETKAAAVQDYHQIFAAIREGTPSGAILMGSYGPMINFYTDRPCLGTPVQLSPYDLARRILQSKVDFFVGTPNLEYSNLSETSASLGIPQTGRDKNIRLITAFDRLYPGTLSVAYLNQEQNFALLRIDRTRLQGMVQQPSAR